MVIMFHILIRVLQKLSTVEILSHYRAPYKNLGVRDSVFFASPLVIKYQGLIESKLRKPASHSSELQDHSKFA